MIAPELKEIFEKYIDFLDSDDYDAFYDSACNELQYMNIITANIGMITSIFQELGIDPLQYMNRIPAGYFMEHSFPGYYKIPENIQVIEAEAFAFADGLEILYCPEGLMRIDMLAFDQCEDLKHIHIPHSVNFIPNGTFTELRDVICLHVPQGSYAETFAHKYKLKYDNNYLY